MTTVISAISLVALLYLLFKNIRDDETFVPSVLLLTIGLFALGPQLWSDLKQMGADWNKSVVAHEKTQLADPYWHKNAILQLATLRAKVERESKVVPCGVISGKTKCISGDYEHIGWLIHNHDMLACDVRKASLPHIMGAQYAGTGAIESLPKPIARICA